MDPKGEGGEGGMNWETGIDICALLILYVKSITNENLLCNLGNPTQCSVVTHMGRKSKKLGLRVYV